MSEVCPFAKQSEKKCFLPLDILRITGVCDLDKRGGNCGAVAATSLIRTELGGLIIEDQIAPIWGQVEVFNQPRVVDPKRNISEGDLKKLVGLTFPLRFIEDQEHEFDFAVKILNIDLYLALYAQGFSDLADKLYSSQALQRTGNSSLESGIVLESSSLELSVFDDSKTSIEFYDRYITSAMQDEIEVDITRKLF